MSLKSKLIPIVASLGAALTIAPALSSCGGLNMETHNMLNNTYYHHVLPHFAETMYDDSALDSIAESYLKDAKVFSSILKDDILYTYSTLVPKTQEESDVSFPYNLSKYYMYVQDFEISTEDKTVNFSIQIDIAGKIKTQSEDYFYYKGDQMEEFDLNYTISFKTPFSFNATNIETEAEKDKIFTIALPSAASCESIDATSMAFGFIKTPNSTESKLINDIEEIHFSSLPTEDTTSLSLYRDFIRNIAVDSNGNLPLVSHYFYYITYKLFE